MEPSFRKPFGVFLAIAWITLYAGLVASFAGTIGTLPWWAQAVVYCLLGFLWLPPMGMLLRWIARGNAR